MYQKKDQGSIEIVVLAVVVLAVIGLVGWRITVALNDQADAEDAVASQQTSADQRKSTTDPIGPVDYSGSFSLSIKDWGVGSKTPLSFTPQVAVRGDTAYLSSTELTLADSSCSGDAPTSGALATIPGAPLGRIVRYAAGSMVEVDNVRVEDYVKHSEHSKVGDYYYVYYSAQATCSDKESAREMQTSQIAAAKELAKSLRPLQ